MPRRDETPIRPPAYERVAGFLEGVFPGTCARMRRFREELLGFAYTPTVRTLFFTSVGADGIPLARLAALLRTTMILTLPAACRRLDAARVVPGGLGDYRILAGAFAELDASAMREADVMHELLGRPAAGGTARAGLFERAMLLDGCRTGDAELTGGFIHVAAPADLPESAQVALAGLCGGAPFPPVGGSDEDEDFLGFDGVSIFTSRRASASEGLRPDVAVRISGHEIAVPQVSELMSDFDLQVDIALRRLRGEYDRIVDRFALSPDAARDYWKSSGPPTRLPQGARAVLREVDWSHHGEAEGLLWAVRAIAGGAPALDVVATLTGPAPPARSDPADALLRQLETLAGHNDKKLAGRVRAVELETRTALKMRLRSDRAALTRLARKLGMSPDVLFAQAAQIDRSRSNADPEVDE